MSTTRETYTHGNHASVMRSLTWRTVQNSAAYLIPELRQGLSLLDVGSGPGTITADFARRLVPGRVVGLDASPEIVRQASGYAAGLGVENVDFVVGNAYALEFDDDTFDVVHAHQVLQHLADPVAALREFRRVTRPGGIVAVRDVDYGAVIVEPESEALTRWRHVYDSVHRSNGGDPHAGRALKRWAHEAGFTDLRTSASVWCFSTDEERAWWGDLWAERTQESALASRAVETGAASRDELAALARGWRDWAAEPDGLFVFPHVEVLARA